MEEKNEEEITLEYIGFSQITDDFRITIPKKLRKLLGMKKNTYDIAAFYGDPETKEIGIKFYSFANHRNKLSHKKK